MLGVLQLSLTRRVLSSAKVHTQVTEILLFARYRKDNQLIMHIRTCTETL